MPRRKLDIDMDLEGFTPGVPGGNATDVEETTTGPEEETTAQSFRTLPPDKAAKWREDFGALVDAEPGRADAGPDGSGVSGSVAAPDSSPLVPQEVGPLGDEGYIEKSAWAVASSAWQKVSPAKKAPYIKHALARHRRDGENVSSSKYAKRAPREFMQRIMGKSSTFIAEFGVDDAAVLHKARAELKASPFMAAHRRSQMTERSSHSKRLARKVNGGSAFPMKSLASSVGEHHDALSDLAHAATHAGDFVAKCRAKYGKKLTHLTDQQLKSAYHSTGLHRSMALTALTEADLDLLKSHKAGEDHCIGHTSTGKPITTKALGAKHFTPEEHDEAAEMHDHLAERLSDAAYGFGSGYSAGRKLPPAAFKYVQKMANEHRNLAARHRASRAAKAQTEAPQIATPEVFKSLNNSPSDSDIAKLIESGTITLDGLVTRSRE